MDVDSSLDHVFFPDSGVVSVVAVYADGSVIEMATIGREGCTGMQAFFGAKSSAVRLLVQIPGSAAKTVLATSGSSRRSHGGFRQTKRARRALRARSTLSVGSMQMARSIYETFAAPASSRRRRTMSRSLRMKRERARLPPLVRARSRIGLQSAAASTPLVAWLPALRLAALRQRFDRSPLGETLVERKLKAGCEGRQPGDLAPLNAATARIQEAKRQRHPPRQYHAGAAAAWRP
jgi:hypothetical protein